jgi:methyltransferase-like protein
MARDAIDMEQYMDFVRNRTFRQSLLCHEDQAIQHQLRADPETVGTFSIATQAEPEDPALDPLAGGVAKFHTAEGATLSTDHPVSKAALLHLSAISPVAVPFADLLAEACRRIYGVNSPGNETFAADARVLASNLVSGYCYSRHLVEFRTWSPRFAAAVSERPLASPLARYLAARDYELVPSLLHERIELDAFSRQLLPKLDGQRDHEALLQFVARLAAQNRIAIEEDGVPVDDPGRARAILAAELEANLSWLAKMALLVA